MDTFSVIIIGAGNLGQALANYKGFKLDLVDIKAIFDIELTHIKDVEDIEVLHIDSLDNYVKANKIDIAIISVQKENAKAIAQKCVNLNIKTIWNFAPIDLYFGEDVALENINMSESLIRLIYKSKQV